MTHKQIHDKLRPVLLEARFSGKTDQECFDLLDAPSIAVKQDIVTRDIQGYLMLLRKWMPLKESAETTAVRAFEILTGLDSLTMTNPAVEAEVTTVLTALADDQAVTFFNDMDKLAILEMSNKYISELDQMEITGARLGHVIVSRTT